MCNLYSIDIGQQAIRDITKAMRDVTGNMPALPAVFPDYFAPVVRNAPDGVRELTMARWGMPSPVFAIAGKKTDSGVTNIGNVKSPHWRRWLGVQSRCVVPFTSFSENELRPDGSRPPAWFALNESRPLAFFAGAWTRWTSVRKVKEGETTNELFAFLTTAPNGVVAPIHPQAMPVILRGQSDIETWLFAPAADAMELQRPLPDDGLRIVARGRSPIRAGWRERELGSPSPSMVCPAGVGGVKWICITLRMEATGSRISFGYRRDWRPSRGQFN